VFASIASMKPALLLIAALALIATAASAPPQTQQADPSNWSAKDAHQGFTVAADAYSNAERSKKTFGKADPYKAGILAVDVFFKNDLKDPVHVDLSTIRLDVDGPNGQHFRLPALTAPQAAEQIAHPKAPSMPRPRLPIPLPSGSSKERSIEKKLTPFSLQSDVVPPNGTLRGMLFFDMGGHFELVPHSAVYIPDVKSVASENAMIYFDVPLGPKHQP
jgi:hypothetical protein